MTLDPANTRPTLLIVDDEAQILSALKRTLRREGYEIVAVESAAAALRVLDERRVDAILSDHKMPGMSGVQLLERVAAAESGYAPDVDYGLDQGDPDRAARGGRDLRADHQAVGRRKAEGNAARGDGRGLGASRREGD